MFCLDICGHAPLTIKTNVIEEGAAERQKRPFYRLYEQTDNAYMLSLKAILGEPINGSTRGQPCPRSHHEAATPLSKSSPPHISHSFQPHPHTSQTLRSTLYLQPHQHTRRPRSSMGNLCGKPSKDNFEGQGRTLGSAPTPATKASIPSNVASAPKRTVGGPARTLGQGDAENDPKAAAAAAAEVRSLSSFAMDKRKSRTALPMTMRAWM